MPLGSKTPSVPLVAGLASVPWGMEVPGMVTLGMGKVAGAVEGTVCRGAVVATVLGRVVEGTVVSVERLRQPAIKRALSKQAAKVM